MIEFEVCLDGKSRGTEDSTFDLVIRLVDRGFDMKVLSWTTRELVWLGLLDGG